MKICIICDTHNLAQEEHCHVCHTVLNPPSNPSWKTAMLLGVFSTGCLGGVVGGQEYGVPSTYEYTDADGDGYEDMLDCDDTDPSIGPETEWFADSDLDGYGDANNTLFACEAEGYVDNDLDCDDTDENIYPDAPEEIGDGIDSNCDGEDDS